MFIGKVQLYYPTDVKVKEEAVSGCPDGRMEQTTSQIGIEPIIPQSYLWGGVFLHIFLYRFCGKMFFFPCFFYHITQKPQSTFHKTLFPLLLQYYDAIQYGCEAVLYWKHKTSWECLTSIVGYMYIVMQMRKVNPEKGYCNTLQLQLLNM